MPLCSPNPRRSVRDVVAALAIFFAVTMAASADTAGHTPFDDREALAISQAALGRSVGDHVFTNSKGSTVTLAEFRGQPVLISLIFTSCYHTCPAITQNLKRAVAAARASLGRHPFSVLTIGFDTAADTPARMRLYAREQDINFDNWHFLSADRDTIDALAQDLGFIYYPSTRGFDHLAQISVLDPRGAVYRQSYGQDFTPPAIVEPLRELALGLTAKRSGVKNLIDRVRLFCTVYDPASGRYRFDNSIIVAAVTGVLSLGAIAVFLVRQLRRPDASSAKGSLPSVH